jgi:hypothetical protein
MSIFTFIVNIFCVPCYAYLCNAFYVYVHLPHGLHKLSVHLLTTLFNEIQDDVFVHLFPFLEERHFMKR